MERVNVDGLGEVKKGAKDDANSKEKTTPGPGVVQNKQQIPGLAPSGAQQNFCFLKNEDGDSVLKTWALILHYGFEGTSGDRSQGDWADVENLKSVFQNRNCTYRVESPNKEDLLRYFSNEGEMKKLFDDNQEPNLFIVFIMTHGYPDGELTTHYKDNRDEFENFNVSEIWKEPLFVNKLKLLFVVACRGNIMDVQSEVVLDTKMIQTKDMERLSTKIVTKDNPENKNAVRLTPGPNTFNWIIVFACVETCFGVRNLDGTYLVQAFTKCINELDCDVDLPAFLTRMHKYAEDLNKTVGVGITMEAKIFKHPDYSKLKISRCEEVHNNDAYESFMYNFTSVTGAPLKGGCVQYYCNCLSTCGSDCDKLQKVFKKKLAFDINPCKSKKDLEVAMQTENTSAAVIICIKTRLSVDSESDGDAGNDKKKQREIFASMRTEQGNTVAVPIKEILYNLIPATTKNYVGKPKLCVFLHEGTAVQMEKSQIEVCYAIDPSTRKRRSGTMHSGFLILILPQIDSATFFIDEMDKLSVQRDSTYQQLFYDILQKANSGDSSETLNPQLISTGPLLFKIQYPKPIMSNFYIQRNNGKNETINTLEGLVEKMNFQDTTPSFWLIHSLPERGKSHLIDYLENRAKVTRSTILLNFFEDYLYLRNKKTSYTCAKKFAENYLMHNHILRKVGQNEIIILDDFDAAEPKLKENFMKLVPCLLNEGFSVWIGTRPHTNDFVKSKLPANAINSLEIKQWTEEEHDVFFKHCLMNDEKFTIQRTKFQLWEAEDLLQSPWLMRKIAANVEEEIEEDKNLFLFCEKFLGKRIDEILQGHWLGIIKENNNNYDLVFEDYMKCLQLCALFYFSNNFAQKNLLKDDQIAQINNTGIFSIQNDKVIVVSETLAKYLAFNALQTEDFGAEGPKIRIAEASFEKMKEACRIMTNHFIDHIGGEKTKFDDLWASFKQHIALEI
ncbi:uncharacterized protein LOC132205506 [Neocloeon triangulifer]|uniref:uncharacterized protein LOC132205506 n=1 Tax=Neocloeon triangulifer TaxID=2078957 RepID=UPI00286F7341|nr:uncharacterized protein LOC132205506 [Neocloeon triangulifer]XP_059490577.1 uncharacterized protein LOC132205506 [Neocloeon triangulifer]